jgi:SAM-dependent methyltransferase
MDLTERPDGSFRRHPWETARTGFFRRVLLDAGAADRPVRVLDVGAGDGWFAARLLEKLHPASAVVCWDTGYESPSDAAAGIAGGDERVSCSTVRPAGRFDFILLLDVLEHVEDDAAFLRAILDGCLAPGGRVLVSVPAWPALYGEHDRRLRHHRRYAPAQARRLLETVGLRVLRGGGLFHALLAPRLLQLARERLLPGRPAARHDLGTWNHGPAVTAAIGWALSTDNALTGWAARAGVDLPGLSWWALCELPARTTA